MKRAWLHEIAVWAGFAAAVFTINTAAARRMYIPSGSMMPTLVKGDQLLVTKYPYGFSVASLALHGNLQMDGRLFGRLPARGDIVTVMRRSDGEDLIKRVIGLPGDTIAVRHGQLILNGKPVPRVYRGPAALPADTNLPCNQGVEARYLVPGSGGRMRCGLPVYRETLPNGVSYDTVDLGTDDIGMGYVSPGDEYGPVRVPADHLFLMGDNRDNSADSRFPLAAGGLGGPVPAWTINGRAEVITHSYDGSGSWLNPVSWVTTMRKGRSWIGLRPDKG